jgi:hypothetical protein
MSTSVAGSSIITLNWADEDGIITVTPEDESRFNVKLRRAIQMLQVADRVDQFTDQFKLLNQVLAKWTSNQTDIDRAFVTLLSDHILFVVVRKTVEYDEDFEDRLSNLDLTIAQDVDMDLIRMHSIALPHSSEMAIRSFLHPNVALEFVRGGGVRPYSTGE